MDERYRKRLTAGQIFSLPNILSYIRILMIPIIIVCYLSLSLPVTAAILVIASGFTDVLDGFIARKFHMVTDFGKLVDPIADKLTQAALICGLVPQYLVVVGLVVLMAVKELLLLKWGLKAFHEREKVNSSKWFGKLCSLFIYLSLFVLFLRPIILFPEFVAYILIGLCVVFVVISTILYGMFYKKFFKN